MEPRKDMDNLANHEDVKEIVLELRNIVNELEIKQRESIQVMLNKMSVLVAKERGCDFEDLLLEIEELGY